MLTRIWSSTYKIYCLALMAFYASNLAGAQVLNGSSIHSEFQMDYYLAELYIANSSTDPDAILKDGGDQAMELTILADDWSKRRFQQHWNQAILINNASDARSKYDKEVAAFKNSLKGNLKRGDKIKIKKRNGKDIKVTLNGVELMSSTRSNAFSLFLNSWIGARPSSSSFKAEILGTSQLDRTRIGDLSAPSDKRKKEILAWVKPSEPAPKPKKKEVVVAKSKPVKKAAPKKVAPKIAKKVIPKKPTPIVKKPAPKPAPVVATTAAPKVVPTVAAPKPRVAATVASTPVKPAASIPVAKAVRSTVAPAAVQPSAAPVIAVPKPAPVVVAKAPAKPTPAVKVLSEQDKLLSVYRSNILILTYQNLIYPGAAIDRGEEGKVVVKLTVNRKGRVTNVDFKEKSEFNSLNKAAEKAIANASPFPKPPKKVQGKYFELILPITFALAE